MSMPLWSSHYIILASYTTAIGTSDLAFFVGRKYINAKTLQDPGLQSRELRDITKINSTPGWIDGSVTDLDLEETAPGHQ